MTHVSLEDVMTGWEKIKPVFKLKPHFRLVVPLPRLTAVIYNVKVTDLTPVRTIEYECHFGGYGGVPVARIYARIPEIPEQRPIPVAIFRLEQA